MGLGASRFQGLGLEGFGFQGFFPDFSGFGEGL